MTLIWIYDLLMPVLANPMGENQLGKSLRSFALVFLKQKHSKARR
jgi:hypothetical protein